ncbi:DUF1737 domain-containing protein [Spirosoma sp. BT702]|uniref:DUF1737 domain-containing protein n=1 Tax=Spirosoma profusum TaxID=2771354 RepID=A0A927APG3_9BACT|nr:DUF1737 domain-containing protein [Spirosoma profusum]MBD2704429.1 DUF1737 domain-containing protein [Spirosoma profusum]
MSGKKKYQILMSTEPEHLVQEVNLAIDNGYACLGAPFINPNNYRIYQAMELLEPEFITTAGYDIAGIDKQMRKAIEAADV